MKGYRRKPRRDAVHREVWEYKTEVKEITETRARIALTDKVEEDKNLEMYGGGRYETGIKTY